MRRNSVKPGALISWCTKNLQRLLIKEEKYLDCHSDDIISTSRPMCWIVCRPAWSCVLVDGNGTVDNVSGRALRCHSIFCAVTWGFWSCFNTQCSSWLTSLLRFYSAIESWGVLFWSTQITLFPAEWLSRGCECHPHSLMRNYVPASLMNPSVPLHFSVPFSLCSSLPLSPSPFLLLSLLCLSSDCDALRAEITSACVLHSLPNTQASFSRLTKRELRLILA